MHTAYFGAGCFWCVEAIFQRVQGVQTVVSGYMGGAAETANYRDVCTGDSGHAEVVQVDFEPTVIGYDDLVRLFFSVHDPTTLNRQGNDVGTQYRSVIFFNSPEQIEVAQRICDELAATQAFPRPLVTEICPAGTFYPAENYHQNYFNNNTQQPYCQYIILPKLQRVFKITDDCR